MGCVSSKIITRSSSFHEELNQSISRTANGYPVLEELFIPKNGGDKFLPLISKKFRTGNLTLDSNTEIKPSLEQTKNSETINTWELLEGLEEGEQEQKESQTKMDRFTDLSIRSKSFHWFSEYELSIEGSSSGVKEHESNRNRNGIARSRSFHTVEEFDEMMKRDRLYKERDAKVEDLVDINEIAFHKCSFIDMNSIEVEEKDESLESFSKEKNGGKDKNVIEETVALKSHERRILDTGNFMKEKGLGRKSMAKELRSLNIPFTINDPDIGSLREWLEEGGEVFSPGAYVTPKFGSFTLQNTMDGKKHSESSIFAPEIVTAFDEDMKQLKAEEEHILSQIIEDLEEDDTKEKEDEVETTRKIEE